MNNADQAMLLRHGNADARERAGRRSPGWENGGQKGDEKNGRGVPDSQCEVRDDLRRRIGGGGKGGDDRHSLMHIGDAIASSATPSRTHVSHEATGASRRSYHLSMNLQHVQAAPATPGTLAFK